MDSELKSIHRPGYEQTKKDKRSSSTEAEISSAIRTAVVSTPGQERRAESTVQLGHDGHADGRFKKHVK